MDSVELFTLITGIDISSVATIKISGLGSGPVLVHSGIRNNFKIQLHVNQSDQYVWLINNRQASIHEVINPDISEEEKLELVLRYG